MYAEYSVLWKRSFGSSGAPQNIKTITCVRTTRFINVYILVDNSEHFRHSPVCICREKQGCFFKTCPFLVAGRKRLGFCSMSFLTSFIFLVFVFVCVCPPASTQIDLD